SASALSTSAQVLKPCIGRGLSHSLPWAWHQLGKAISSRAAAAVVVNLIASSALVLVWLATVWGICGRRRRPVLHSGRRRGSCGRAKSGAAPAHAPARF